MKDYWKNLNAQEKQAILLGCVALFFIFLYQGINMPLKHAIEKSHRQIKNDKDLLGWMQNADNSLKSTKPHQSLTNKKSFAADIQRSLKESPIASFLSQMQQVTEDTVECRFNNVNFNEFSQWLLLVTHNSNLLITQISATQTANGSANVILKLQIN